MKNRLGVDIGGTFTDIVLQTETGLHSTKVLTTYAAPENAIIAGLHQVVEMAGMTAGDIDQIIHGTTLATNALIERRGAKTALITTKGFRDVIEMRTESRFEQYDLNLTLPEPLLPRHQRYTITERLDADGEILIPLNTNEVKALAEELKSKGFESIAIGFLHAYANDKHEQQVAKILAEALPEAMISLSSEVSPQMREYERFNTTVANAYIKPLMKSYLSRLQDKLGAEGIACPIFLMHSGGGIMSLQSAAELPVRLVESGPAGGAIFAAHLAAKHGLQKVLSFDMGGTTAKICMIKDHSPKTARVFEVARTYRFKKGSGMPISIPVIDMVEIGAGGGSLAHVDSMQQIRVGPESAGSEPGPACYGRGGDRPAVTDADLVLKKLDADNFAGGSIKLSADQSEQALKQHIGDELNLGAVNAAFGLAEVVDENMANAARVHAVENGEDLSTYTMIAFGGAAPLHAGRLCEKLGIEKCLIPEGAGVGSAIGFLKAPFSFEANRSLFMPMSSFDGAKIKALFSELKEEAIGFVKSCTPSAQIEASYRVYMRYAGQGWEIPVSLPQNLIGDLRADAFVMLFEAAYEKLFGRSVEGIEIEITGWSVNAFTTPEDVVALEEQPASKSQEFETKKDLFDPALAKFVSAQAVRREELKASDQISGPAIVSETETTVIVPSSFNIVSLSDGTLVLFLKVKMRFL